MYASVCRLYTKTTALYGASYVTCEKLTARSAFEITNANCVVVAVGSTAVANVLFAICK